MIHFMDELLSILQRLTLEDPGPVVILLVLAGAVLGFSAVHRKRRVRALVAGGLWVLAAGVFILSMAVTTQREEVQSQTHRLLHAATAPVEMVSIRQLLASDAELIGPDGALWLTFDKLPDEIDQALTRWPVRQLRVGEMDVTIRGDTAQVMLRLSTRTREDLFPVGTATRWRLDWRRDGLGQWRLERIQWLEWMGKPPSLGVWR